MITKGRRQKAEGRRVWSCRDGFSYNLCFITNKLSPKPAPTVTYFPLLNHFYGALLGLGMGILLIGCAATAPVNSQNITFIPQQEATKFPKNQELAENSGQMLPISAKAKFASGEVVQLEVTRTPAEQSLGLMYRRNLPDDRGMLFSFSPAQRVSFWMKNVVIPLDMVFLRDGVIRAIAANVPPCKQDPCPSYGPDQTIDQVIELRGGRAAELGIKVGQQVKIESLSPQSRNHTKSLREFVQIL